MNLLLWQCIIEVLLLVNLPLLKAENIEDLGCWKDNDVARALPLLEKEHPLLKDLYKKRSNPIIKCAQVAHDKGFSLFALQNGGQCFGGKNGEKTFQMYGPSNLCKNGTGGRWSSNIYSTKTFHRRMMHDPVDPSPWDPYCTRDLDIILLLDGSGPRSSRNSQKRWEDLLLFAQKFVKGFDSHARIGIIKYGGDPQIPVDMAKAPSPDKLVELIKGLEMPGGKRMLNDALKTAWRDQLKESNRSVADKVVVALTTGNVPYGLYGSSQFLSDHLVRVVAIGVDRDVNYEFLQSVASYRDVKNIFSVNRDQLGDIAPYVYRDICNTYPDYVSEPTTTKPPTTTTSTTLTPPETNVANKTDSTNKNLTTGDESGKPSNLTTAKGAGRNDIITIPLSEIPIQLLGLKKDILPNQPYEGRPKDGVITVDDPTVPKQHLASMVLVNPNPGLNLALTREEVHEINYRESNKSTDNGDVEGKNNENFQENYQNQTGLDSTSLAGNETSNVYTPADQKLFATSEDEYYAGSIKQNKASDKVSGFQESGKDDKNNELNADNNGKQEESVLQPKPYKGNPSSQDSDTFESSNDVFQDSTDITPAIDDKGNEMKEDSKSEKNNKNKEDDGKKESEKSKEKEKDKEKGKEKAKGKSDFRIENSKFKPKYIPVTKSEYPVPPTSVQEQEELKTVPENILANKPGELTQTMELHSGNGKEHVSEHSIDFNNVFSGRLLDKKKSGQSPFFQQSISNRKGQEPLPTKTTMLLWGSTASHFMHDGYRSNNNAWTANNVRYDKIPFSYKQSAFYAKPTTRNTIPTKQNQKIINLLGAIERVAKQTATMAKKELKGLDKPGAQKFNQDVLYRRGSNAKRVLEVKGHKIDALLNLLSSEETDNLKNGGRKTPEVETKQLQQVFKALGNMFSQYVAKKDSIKGKQFGRSNNYHGSPYLSKAKFTENAVRKSGQRGKSLLDFHPIKLTNSRPTQSAKQHKIKTFLKAFEAHLEDITSTGKRRFQNPAMKHEITMQNLQHIHQPLYKPKASDNVTTFPSSLPFATNQVPSSLFPHPPMNNEPGWIGNPYYNPTDNYNSHMDELLMPPSPIIGPARSNVDNNDNDYFYQGNFNGQFRQDIPFGEPQIDSSIPSEIQSALEENGFTGTEAKPGSLGPIGLPVPSISMIDQSVAPSDTGTLMGIPAIDGEAPMLSQDHEAMPIASKIHSLHPSLEEKPHKNPVVKITQTGNVQHSFDAPIDTSNHITANHVASNKVDASKDQYAHLNLNTLTRKTHAPRQPVPVPKPPSLPNMPSMPEFQTFRHGMKPMRTWSSMKTRPPMKDRKAKDATRLMKHVRKKAEIKHKNPTVVAGLLRNDLDLGKKQEKLRKNQKKIQKKTKKPTQRNASKNTKAKHFITKTGTAKQFIPKADTAKQVILKAALKKSIDYDQPLSIFTHGKSIQFKTSPDISKILVDGIVEKKAKIQNKKLKIKESDFPMIFSISNFTLEDLPLLTKGRSFVLTSPEKGIIRVNVAKNHKEPTNKFIAQLHETTNAGAVGKKEFSPNTKPVSKASKVDSNTKPLEDESKTKATDGTKTKEEFKTKSQKDVETKVLKQDSNASVRKYDSKPSKAKNMTDLSSNIDDNLDDLLEKEKNKLAQSLASLKFMRTTAPVEPPQSAALLVDTEDEYVTHDFSPISNLKERSETMARVFNTTDSTTLDNNNDLGLPQAIPTIKHITPLSSKLLAFAEISTKIKEISDFTRPLKLENQLEILPKSSTLVAKTTAQADKKSLNVISDKISSGQKTLFAFMEGVAKNETRISSKRNQSRPYNSTLSFDLTEKITGGNFNELKDSTPFTTQVNGLVGQRNTVANASAVNSTESIGTHNSSAQVTFDLEENKEDKLENSNITSTDMESLDFNSNSSQQFDLEMENPSQVQKLLGNTKQNMTKDETTIKFNESALAEAPIENLSDVNTNSTTFGSDKSNINSTTKENTEPDDEKEENEAESKRLTDLEKGKNKKAKGFAPIAKDGSTETFTANKIYKDDKSDGRESKVSPKVTKQKFNASEDIEAGYSSSNETIDTSQLLENGTSTNDEKQITEEKFGKSKDEEDRQDSETKKLSEDKESTKKLNETVTMQKSNSSQSTEAADSKPDKLLTLSKDYSKEKQDLHSGLPKQITEKSDEEETRQGAENVLDKNKDINTKNTTKQSTESRSNQDKNITEVKNTKEIVHNFDQNEEEETRQGSDENLPKPSTDKNNQDNSILKIAAQKNQKNNADNPLIKVTSKENNQDHSILKIAAQKNQKNDADNPLVKVTSKENKEENEESESRQGDDTKEFSQEELKSEGSTKDRTYLDNLNTTKPDHSEMQPETTVELQNTTYKIFDPFPSNQASKKGLTNLERLSYHSAVGAIPMQPSSERLHKSKPISKIEAASYNPASKLVGLKLASEHLQQFEQPHKNKGVSTAKAASYNLHNNHNHAAKAEAVEEPKYYKSNLYSTQLKTGLKRQKPFKNVSLVEAMEKMNPSAKTITNFAGYVRDVDQEDSGAGAATMLGCTKPLRLLYVIDVSEGMGRGLSRKRRWTRLKDFINNINDNILRGVSHEYMVYNIEPRMLTDFNRCDKATEMFTIADECLCNKKYHISSEDNVCSVNQPTSSESMDDWGRVGPRAGKALLQAKKLYFNKNNEKYKNVILLLSHKQSVDDLAKVEKDLKLNGISLIDIELGQRHDLRRRNFIPRPEKRNPSTANMQNQHVKRAAIDIKESKKRKVIIKKTNPKARAVTKARNEKTFVDRTARKQHNVIKDSVKPISNKENFLLRNNAKMNLKMNDKRPKTAASKPVSKNDETHKVKVSLRKLTQTLKDIIGTVCKTNTDDEESNQVRKRSIRSIDFYH